MPGVVRTRVGYAGGSTEDPTYRSLADHTETIQIDFDPSRISYGELLNIFWKSHDPGHKTWSPQYKAVIFFHNEDQKRLAFESRKRAADREKGPVYTEILPHTGFFLAEDYHQKYRLQQEQEILGEYYAIYPSFPDFLNSTAVARVNGYLGGYGTPEDLKREIDGYGLSGSGKERLKEILAAARTAFRNCPL